jgi:hypothetical protein
MLSRVSDGARRERVLLEIDVQGDAPEGMLVSEDVSRPFSGWTEFASVIEDWRAEAARALDTQDELGPWPSSSS